MQSQYPKFDQRINDQISAARMQSARPRMGTVAQYNKHSNTLTVIIESQYSDTVGGILENVPCPINYGIQSVQPEPGDRCVVGFRDESETIPYIINFIDDFSSEKKINMDAASNGIPRYMI